MADVNVVDIKDGEIANEINSSTGIIGAKRAQLMCENAEKVAKVEVAGQLSWGAILQGVLLAVGAAKQYDALEKQGDLFEAQRDVALRNIALAERTYNETFLPSYKEAEKYFHKEWRRKWESQLEKIVACGMKDCEYKPDYNRWINRGVSEVAKAVNNAKRTAKRFMDCYSVGACADNDYRFAALQSRLMVETINNGRIYEDNFKLQRDQFLFNKMTTAASVIQNLGQLASGLLQYGKQGIISGLQLNQSAQNGLANATATGFLATNNSAQFFGSLGGLAGQIGGSQYGQSIGQMILDSQPTVGLSNIGSMPMRNDSPLGVYFGQSTPASNASGVTGGIGAPILSAPSYTTETRDALI